MKSLSDEIQRKFTEHTLLEQELSFKPGSSSEDVPKYELSILKSRLKMRDELLVLFQNSLITLISDNDYSFVENTQGLKLVCPTFLKDGLKYVFTAYDHELQVLVEELNVVHSILKSNRTYCVELRKQFESQMKSIYR